MADSNSNDAPNKTSNKKAAPPKKPSPAKPLVERKFRSNTSYHSDLFKLKMAKVLKWMGFTASSKKAPLNRDGSVNQPDWQAVEHVHFFRTVNSKGKPQIHSNPIGNHFHIMEIIRDESDPMALPEIKCVSGPMEWGVVEQYGKMERVPVPVENDEHTHGIEYIKSDELKRPDMNPEALKVIGAQANRNSSKVYDENGKPMGDLAIQ